MSSEPRTRRSRKAVDGHIHFPRQVKVDWINLVGLQDTTGSFAYNLLDPKVSSSKMQGQIVQTLLVGLFPPIYLFIYTYGACGSV